MTLAAGVQVGLHKMPAAIVKLDYLERFVKSERLMASAIAL